MEADEQRIRELERGFRRNGLPSFVVERSSLFSLVAGLGSILRWAGTQFFARLGPSLNVLARAVPLVLFFSLIMFFTTEMWQAFTASGAASYWTVVILFALLSVGFISAQLPAVVRKVESGSDVGPVPLRRRERINLSIVAFVSTTLQVAFVSCAIWCFYLVVGTLLATDDVRDVWLTHADHVIWSFSWFGDPVQITEELLRVATAIASFTALYYSVSIFVNATYQDQFVDSMNAELREVFAHRAEYLDRLERAPDR